MVIAELNTILFSSDLLYVRVISHVNRNGHLYYKVVDKNSQVFIKHPRLFRFLRPIEFLSVSLFFKPIIAPGSIHDVITTLGKATVSITLENRKLRRKGLPQKSILDSIEEAAKIFIN